MDSQVCHKNSPQPMVGVMLYLNWRFTLIALSVAPPLFLVVYTYTRRIKKASRDVRNKEGEIVSVIEEVLTSIRVVKAFDREEYELRRLEEESLEGVEIALKARALKAKLAPIVSLIVAVGTALVLWFGAKLVLQQALSAGAMNLPQLPKEVEYRIVGRDLILLDVGTNLVVDIAPNVVPSS